MPTKWKPGPGTIYIDGVAYDGALVSSAISTEEIKEYVEEYVRSIVKFNKSSCTFDFTLNRIGLLKAIGIWELVRRNCPSPRVRHLMEHGSERTRYKNFKHACRLMCKILRRGI